MTLADLFLAVNAAGICLANVGGQLQLRGPRGAITQEIRAGAGEHKEAILALLRPEGEPSAASTAVEEQAPSLQEIPMATMSQESPAFPPIADRAWDEEEARRLLQPALQALDLHGYSSDPTVRALEFAAADCIDSCWLSQDKVALTLAVGRFLTLMQERQEPAFIEDIFDPRLRLDSGCPGCDFCLPKGREAPPRPGEDLESTWRRILGR